MPSVATGSEEDISFVDYISGAKFRFLQERLVGLDLYYSGTLGLVVFCLFVAVATVFTLAIFQVIAKRRHVVSLLLGLGGTSFLLGLTCSYMNFQTLLEGRGDFVRASAGALPVERGQEAVVIALPLLLGGMTLGLGLFGCLYLSLFWGRGMLSKEGKKETKR